VLTSKDLKSLPEEQSHEIEVLEFVPSDQVDPIMFEKAYYLEPDSRSPKAYVLLRETLDRTERTAVVQFTLRQKTRLGVLRVHGDVLLLQGLLWADEVRAADFKNLDADAKVSANELKMSSSLVESMSTDFDPGKFTDEYQVQLQQLIDAKLEAGDDVDTAATFGEQDSSDEGEGGGGDVIDLMAALRASVDKNRQRRSGSARTGGSGQDDDEKPAPRRRASGTAAKSTTSASGTTKSATKSSSKSTASKSTTTKTAPAKKPAARKKAS
jgi:DNA end-binding protein Ku